MIVGARKVLVIAAHADDEVLGCGGIIARHVDQGDQVDLLIVCDGVSARDPRNYETARKERESAANAAASILGVTSLKFLNQPDNRLDTIAILDLIKLIEETIDNYKPQAVYTHSPEDLNIDHRIVSEATLVACRPQANMTVKKICFYEVLSSTEWSFNKIEKFTPNLYVGIEKQLERKLSALDAYRDEIRDFPHPRSKEAVLALATLRGSASGMRAAEAFYQYRNIKS